MENVLIFVISFLFLRKYSQCESCICVPFYSCEDDYSEEKYETGDKLQQCNDDLNVCCFNITANNTEELTARLQAKSQNQLFQCELPLQCISLKNCESLTRMMKTYEDLHSTLQYLNTIVCGQNKEKEPKVCCPDLISNHKSIKKQLGTPPCDPAFHCVSLLKCGPLMHLVNLEKPMTTGFLRFLKTQQCGLGKIYPKVCCKLPTEVEPKLTTAISATEEPVTSTISLKEKSVIMNKIFSDFFDLMI